MPFKEFSDCLDRYFEEFKDKSRDTFRGGVGYHFYYSLEKDTRDGRLTNDYLSIKEFKPFSKKFDNTLKNLSTFHQRSMARKPVPAKIEVAKGLYWLAKTNARYAHLLREIEYDCFLNNFTFEKISQEYGYKESENILIKVNNHFSTARKSDDLSEVAKENDEVFLREVLFEATQENIDYLLGKSNSEEKRKLFEERSQITAGNPDTVDLGMLGCISAKDGQYTQPYSVGEEFWEELSRSKDFAKRVSHILASFFSSSSKDAFFDSILKEENFWADLGLEDPGAEFLEIAAQCYSNPKLFKGLRQHSSSNLVTGKIIVGCIDRAVRSVDHLVNYSILTGIAGIDCISSKSRALLYFLSAKSANAGGQIEAVNLSLSRADEFLKKGQSPGNFESYLDTLAPHITAERIKANFAALQPSRIDVNSLTELGNLTSEGLSIYGITNQILSKPDTLAQQISEMNGMSHGAYLSAFYRYNYLILKQFMEGNRTSDLFDMQFTLNTGVATTLPRTACVLLTPLTGIAMHVGNNKACAMLCDWRNGQHPVSDINRIQPSIDGTEEASTEGVIKWILNYNNLKMLSDNCVPNAEVRLEEAKLKLNSLELQVRIQPMSSISRYYDRFLADVTHSSESYVTSECRVAKSHHFFFGSVDDWISRKAEKG